jgi:hypothetical protein
MIQVHTTDQCRSVINTYNILCRRPTIAVVVDVAVVKFERQNCIVTAKAVKHFGA